MTQTTEQIIALAADTGAVAYSPPPFRAVKGYSFTYEELEDFFRAAIESYKAELLKEVGEPVGKIIDEDSYGLTTHFSCGIPKSGTDLYTSDQVAAAIVKATKPLEDQLAAAQHELRAANSECYLFRKNGRISDANEIATLKDQLTKAEQRIAELEGDVAIEHASRKYWEDAYSEWLNTDKAAQGLIAKDERIAELIAELEHIREQKNLLWFEFSIATQQLAASQLRETQLRELIKRAHEFVRDGLCNDGLSSLMEALSLPTDTSALDAYVEGKVKEAMK